MIGRLFRPLLAAGVALAAAACLSASEGDKTGASGPREISPEFWLTDPAGSVLLRRQHPPSPPSGGATASIVVDHGATFQTVDGFGYTLTGGSAMMIDALEAREGDALLKELFSPEGDGIGTSYLRISLGASDLDPAAFSYDDMPPGQKDPELKNFSLGPHKKDLVPVLKRILAIDPDIKLLASTWSPPPWMKARSTFIGSSLADGGAYARYIVRYIQAMREEGIRIDAITVQNEPLNPDNEPSMIMTPAKQRDFIKYDLGPAFAREGIRTKILLYDHNCDEPGYPLSILEDEQARRFIDGSAFHLYAGDISALSMVHDAHPDKNVYFTEQWVGAPGNLAEDFRWHVKTVIIGSMRNWSKTALEWNLASDPAYDPHTPGGCETCLGALTIGGGIKRNPAYYIVAQAAKFIRPGSVRIGSNLPPDLPNVAFKTPDGKTALIVLNDGASARTFRVSDEGKTFAAVLNPGAAGTFVW